MTAASTNPIAKPAITSDMASVRENDVSPNRTIDESQYNTSPIQLFPNTVQEEINNTRQFAANQNGDEFFLNNNNMAFSDPRFNEIFQARMQKSVQRMIQYAQVNNQFKPVISLQNVDYNDFSLKSNKEYFSVDATTLQAFKSSQTLREAGITVLGMPSAGAKFELVAYDQTGKPFTGSDWNNFFEQYGDIVAQEYSQAQTLSA